MRLVRITGRGTGLILDFQDHLHVIDIAGCAAVLRADNADLARRLDDLSPTPQHSWLPWINDWPATRETLRQLALIARDDLGRGDTRLPVDPYQGLALDPPLPDPSSRIFAMGGNFAAHASVMNAHMTIPESVSNPDAATPPWGFYVIPGTVVGQGATVTPPRHTQYLDYEAEVAVVLGAEEHQPGTDQISIWGYTAWNDFSIRDTVLGVSKTDHGPLTWSLTKNFRTGNSCGPWMVVNYPPVDNLAISCTVNGDVRQEGNTSQMRFSFGAIAAYLSTYVPLGAGDMIVSGTPAGTAVENGLTGKFLRSGDRVSVTIDGVDELANSIWLTE